MILKVEGLWDRIIDIDIDNYKNNCSEYLTQVQFKNSCSEHHTWKLEGKGPT